MTQPYRCQWCVNSELEITYHDEEWGVPVHEDRKHFEFLVLDAFQAGLSWSIILRKRENFREAFDNFEPERIAKYTKRRIERLMENAGIVRNRLKILASVSNAKRFLAIQDELGTFDDFIWQFVGGKTHQNSRRSFRSVPAKTTESDAMSKALKNRGFKFVGSTICYAYMQAAGMVNDHEVKCHRFPVLGGRSRS
jgi:DNA-3-methyladenine glycosylase I